MELREAQSFGVIDNHQARIGHVHANLDDGCRYQQLELPLFELSHGARFFSGL